MKINSREKSFRSNSVAFDLINHLINKEATLSLKESNLYYDFPIFKDVDGDILISQILIISNRHGILLISVSDASDVNKLTNSDNNIVEKTEQLHPIIFSRLLRNKNLRKSRTELKIPITSFLFCPNISITSESVDDLDIVTNLTRLDTFISYRKTNKIDDDLYQELVSTLEGAKGILKAKERLVSDKNGKKGLVASEIEREINAFDQYQKKAFMNEILGPERIRGLAGSGKTVILALKAAIAHLRDPNANIVYTFYTKSLYQHIQRLITRFYRQYDDKDPDWDKLKILHAWGGHSNSGIYFDACDHHSVYYYNFDEASKKSKSHPFDFACKALLDEPNLKPMYDYVFIDEGQDFPTSFLKLCLRLAEKGRIVWAYDELQTIFQATTPDISELLINTNYSGLEEDIILYKCYRNPREVLVVAHALGFGIYGKRIVQMIENKEYWNDIGYKVLEGEFKKGEIIVIERPQENSLETVSNNFNKNEILKFKSFNEFSDELSYVIHNIEEDLTQGLLPDDILVIVVDDRNAKSYLDSIQKHLAARGIKSNNIHSDRFNLKDFNLLNHVTLSTVHKAKGNEAYSVHIVGIDALYALDPSIRQRNLIFTAITRAKGWISISGIGKIADMWNEELKRALENSPMLRFVYPSSHELKIMKRDIEEKTVRKSRQTQIMDELLTELSPEEIKLILEQREIKKIKK